MSTDLNNFLLNSIGFKNLVYKNFPSVEEYPEKWAEFGINTIPYEVEVLFSNQKKESVSLERMQELSNKFNFVNPLTSN